MTNEQAVASKLLQVEAVKLNPQNPYTWASGWKSPIYCDNRKVLSFPTARDFIKSELCSVIFNQFPDVDALAGVATAGIAWGAMAADQLKLPFMYVRPKPKDHGMGNQIEGNLEKGSKVLVIEDLISTGKSSLQVCDVLKASGVEVVGMIAIFTYGFPQASKAFDEAGVKLVTLTNYNVMIDIAAQQNKVSPDEMSTLMSWRENPAEWTGLSLPIK
jgi:orotate phosphoribosyltransferase